MNHLPVKITFIEDDEASLELLLDNLKTWDVVNPVLSFRTCEEAWEFLFQASDEQLPDVIFLDVKFKYSPMQGDELLEKLYSDTRLSSINIAMMTSLTADITTVNRYYESGVKAFFDKPIDSRQFNDFMRKLMFKIQYIKHSAVAA